MGGGRPRYRGGGIYPQRAPNFFPPTEFVFPPKKGYIMAKHERDLTIFAFSLFSPFSFLFFSSLFSFLFLKFLGGGAITSQNMGVGHMPTSPPPSEYVPEQKEPKLRHKSYSGKVKIYIYIFNLGPKRLRQSSWSKISLTGKMIKGLVWVSYLRFFYIHMYIKVFRMFWNTKEGRGGGWLSGKSFFMPLLFIAKEKIQALEPERIFIYKSMFLFSLFF